MEKFQKTISGKAMTEEQCREIALEMVEEASGKKGVTIDVTKYDWGRATWADPRDQRCVQAPCHGSHSVEKFGRGSKSGNNRWALWLVCQKCTLRVAYVPTWGSPGVYRSAGPLPKDVATHIENKEAQQEPLNPKEMSTKKLGYEAAEASALKQLEHIRMAKSKLDIAPQVKAKSARKMTPATKKSQRIDLTKDEVPTSTLEAHSSVKRGNPVTPEVQEQETAQGSDGWEQVQQAPNS